MEDPATKRHYPRNYLQSLEERVAVLEAMLQEVRPEVANDHFRPDHGDADAATVQTLSNTSPDAQEQQNLNMPLEITYQNHHTEGFQAFHLPFEQPQTSEEASVMTDLSSKIGLLSVNAPNAEPHYFGTSSALAMSRLINSALRRVNHDNPTQQDLYHVGSSSSAYDMLLATPSPLPPAEGRQVLAKSYFEYIHPQFPFLHEPTFRSWEQMLVESSDSDDAFSLQPIIPFFVNMVCLIIVSHWLDCICLTSILRSTLLAV